MKKLKKTWEGTLNILVLIVALVVCFAILEGSLRFIEYKNPGSVKRLPSVYRASSIDGLPFENIPGKIDVFKGKRVEINSQGFRDDEFVEDSRVKIALIGDSTAFGWGVAKEDMYATLLESDLNVQVLNFAVAGYNSAEEWIQYENIIAAYEPDAILLNYDLNDADENIMSQKMMKRSIDTVYYWLASRTVSQFFFATLLNNLVTSKQEIARVNEVLASEDVTDLREEEKRYHYYSLLLRETYSDDNPAWLSTQEALGRFGALDVPVYAFIVPIAFPNSDPYTIAPLDSYEKVHSVFSDVGICTIDVITPYYAVPNEDIVVHLNDRHPNARGHRIIADAIIEKFRSNEC